MKKLISILFIIITITLTGITANAESTENNSYIYVENLSEGVYNIDVKSSSSMFRIVNCELNISKNEMTAVMTLSGTGYEKLFMGTGEEALEASDDSYIYFVEDSEGKYTYTVPVEALDKEIDCAAWSIRKEKWYDRELVFQSDSLPEDAFKKPFNFMYVIIPSTLAVAAAAVIIVICVKKSKSSSSLSSSSVSE